MSVLEPISTTDWQLVCLAVASGVFPISMATAAAQLARRRSFSQLCRKEDGGVYSVSLLMLLPTFVTVLGLFIEVNSLLLTRVGMEHAGFAAARSAAVWTPADRHRSAFGVTPPRNALLRDWGQVVQVRATEASASTAELRSLRQRCRFAAAKALAPFVSGADRHGVPETDSVVNAHADAFAAAADETLLGTHDRAYLRQKFLNSHQAIRIGLRVSPPEAAGQTPRVTVIIRFASPIGMPWIGRLIGTRAGDLLGGGQRHHVFEMSADCTLAVERPLLNHDDIDRFAMGVRYGE